MLAKELQSYLRSLNGGWMDLENTVYDVDLAICTDDGFTYWQDAAYAWDAGLPTIVVNHATSEEPGMRQLAAHLTERFPEVPVHFVPRGCLYRLVAPEG